jgi:hypothetical protein
MPSLATVQVPIATVLIRTDHGPLENREVGFSAVDCHIVPRLFAITMLDGLMGGKLPAKPDVVPGFISVQPALLRRLRFDKLPNVSGG